MTALNAGNGAERDMQWSSSNLVGNPALNAWNILISDHVAEMTIDSDERSAFRAGWVRYGLGPIDINNFRTAPQTIARTAAMVRRCPDEVYALAYMQQGSAAVVHDGVDVHLPQGSFILVNHATPYRFHFPEAGIALTAHMPGSWLRRWVPQPESMLIKRFDAQTWGGALAAMLCAIDRNGLQDAALSRSSIADQLGSFLALMNGNVSVGESLHQGKLFKRALTFMRDRFDQPELCPEALAAEFGISKRYVHKIFAGQNTTFGAELLTLRLNHAKDILQDARFAAYRISDVAYACGFADPSHFARKFRDRFGHAPLALRNHA